MSARKSCKFSAGEDGLGIHDIFTNLPCDVGMEGLLIGHISASLPAVSDVFPFRVSLYMASRKEEYSTSCDQIKGRAYNASDKRRIRKNTFVKRQ